MYTSPIWKTQVRHFGDSFDPLSFVLTKIKGPGVTANIDSARANLAGTFVNGFVNAGFGNDKLLVEADEGNSWIYKNKDHGLS